MGRRCCQWTLQFAERQEVKTKPGDEIPLRLLQANVLTLHPVRDDAAATSDRMEDLGAKFAKESIALAFLQEART